ncbi:hypothetical protein ALO90_200182 [Pseudomonas amygdali pv. aesculi]|nr:hypothetical protein ALO90_200182 [Pseudomonas amygdali pv. aesculi]
MADSFRLEVCLSNAHSTEVFGVFNQRLLFHFVIKVVDEEKHWKGLVRFRYIHGQGHAERDSYR